MLKLFLLLGVLLSLSFAKTIDIKAGFTKVSSAEYQDIVEDKNLSLCATQILEQHIEPNELKPYTSYTTSAFWTKTTLHNSAEKPIAIIFKNLRAGTRYINVSIYEKNKLLITHALGDMLEPKERLLPGTNSAFYFELAPKQEITVITRFESLGVMYLSWEISNTQIYAKIHSWNLLIYGVFGGVVLALVIYNFMMYRSLRDISFIFYIIHALSILWYQYAYSGVLYFMDLGIDLHFLKISSWFVPYIIFISLLLYTISFFKMYEKNPRFFYLFSFLVVVNGTIFLLMAYQYFDQFIIPYTSYFIPFSFVTFLSILIFAIYALYKGYSNAIYFLIGEGIYISTMLFVALAMLGVKSNAQFEYYLLPFGVMCEMVLISIALSTRVAKIKKDNEINDMLMTEEIKFSSIGKSIGNVTHQWKEPLNRLSAYVVHLEALYYTKQEQKLLNEFESSIHKISDSIAYMKGSIDELYYFYSGSGEQSVRLKPQIELASKLQQDKLMPLGVTVVLVSDEESSIYGAKHAFANVLMILFDNSISQFSTHKTINPTITITVSRDEQTILINFEDNGGGILVTPIDKVFQANFSTKGDEGSGLGLSLAKKLVTERLGGKISAQNTPYGALFSISLASH